MLPAELKIIATTVLLDYVGVAAQFIVDDAIKEVSNMPSISGKKVLEEVVFYHALASLLPPELPFEKIRSEIAKN